MKSEEQTTVSNIAAGTEMTKNKKYPPIEQHMQTSTYKNQSTILYLIHTQNTHKMCE